MKTNGQSATVAGQATGSKYRVFKPDYVLFALENWAVEANLQLLTHIVEKSSNSSVKAQAKQLLAYFEALGIPEALKLNLWVKSKEEEKKPKGPSTPKISLFPTAPGKEASR